MPRTLAWQASDDLTREQLSMFRRLGDQINLSEDAQRRALNLDVRSWSAWMDFLADGPMPGEPALPEMLRRLGETAFSLSAMVDQVAVQAGNSTHSRGSCPG